METKNTGFDGQTTHYSCKAGYDAMQVIEDFELNFSLGNAVKYILRCGKKGTKHDAIKDLKKAIAYIDREVSSLEKSMDAENVVANKEKEKKE